jgi:hypothetical protein
MERFKNIPVTEWNRLLRAIEKVAQAAEKGDVLSEADAAKLLGMQSVSLRNRRYDGTIPESCYSKTVAGSFVYYKSKLCNL